MKSNGIEVVIMEISAHAISLHKIDNLKSDITIFTNFSQDHLDFFKTMENYKQTKFKFFKNNTKMAIINADDNAGIELLNELKNKILVKTFGIKNSADINCKFNCKLSGSELAIKFQNKIYNTNLKLAGEFNVYNLLSAILACINLGFNTIEVINSVKNIKRILGRFDIYNFNDKTIIIDYAHTPESFRSIFESVKNLTDKVIVSVFGCPGNRDETKREIMGKIASDYSQKVYITSDNPKYENPLKICFQIAKGCRNYEIILDRFKAIKKAIEISPKNSVILILGKGSEHCQDINNIKMRYSDYNSLFKCIKSLKNK